MTLLGKRVMVKENVPEERKSSGGILLTPEKTDYRNPVVSAIIDYDKDLESLDISAFANGLNGKYAMYLPSSGLLLKREDSTVRIINYEDIIAILDSDEV